MKDSMTDKVQGAFHEAKGKVREAAAIASSHRGLYTDANAFSKSGNIHNKVGHIKAVLVKSRHGRLSSPVAERLDSRFTAACCVAANQVCRCRRMQVSGRCPASVAGALS